MEKKEGKEVKKMDENKIMKYSYAEAVKIVKNNSVNGYESHCVAPIAVALFNYKIKKKGENK